MLRKRALQILIVIFILLILAATAILLLSRQDDVGDVTNAKLVSNPICKEQGYD